MRGVMLRAAAAATVVTTLAGCGAATIRTPSQGGRWVELTSEHFVVWTDANGDRARELIREMERMRQIVVGVAFPTVPSSGKSQVIVLRNDDELAALSLTGEPRAYAMSAQPPLWQPMFVLPAFSNRGTGDSTVAHELTHVISFSVVRGQPRWLAEGMAEYFETVELDPNATNADIGVAPLVGGQPMRMPHLIPVEKLLTWGRPSEGEQREYSTAWALFTFLINEHRAELVRYMQAVDAWTDDQAPPGARAIRLWEAAFSSLPLSEVDDALREWLVSGRHRVLHINIKLQPWPSTESLLGEADVLALRGLLHAVMPGQDAAARADVDAALAAEPTNVLARLLALLEAREPITLEQAHAAAAAHPHDWRAWLMTVLALESAHGDAAELAAARARACALVALNAALAPPRGLCEPALASPPAP